MVTAGLLVGPAAAQPASATNPASDIWAASARRHPAFTKHRHKRPSCLDM